MDLNKETVDLIKSLLADFTSDKKDYQSCEAIYEKGNLIPSVEIFVKVENEKLFLEIVTDVKKEWERLGKL